MQNNQLFNCRCEKHAIPVFIFQIASGQTKSYHEPNMATPTVESTMKLKFC